MKIKTIFQTGTVKPNGVEGKSALRFSPLVLFCILFTGVFFSRPGLSAPVQEIPEIAVDNAAISSPQSTLASLVRLADTYHELVRKDGITSDNQNRVKNILQQFAKLFDLREVPPKYRRKVAAETAVYLREAIARFPIPPIEAIPDEERMVARIKDGKAAVYRLPGTPVVIRKTDAGTYAGRYQFSSATVEEAKDWFAVAKDYPYVEGQGYISGLYEEYFLAPGPMISSHLIRALPAWMQHHFFEQTVWQWFFLILTIALIGGLLTLLYILVKRLSSNRSQLQHSLIFILLPLGGIYLTLGALSFLEEQVYVTGDVLQSVQFIGKLIILATVAILILRLGNVAIEAVLLTRKFNNRQVDKQLVRLGIRMLSVLIAVIVVMEGMQQIGFSLATLVAAAGVIGLAIALAAQDTLKNVFGGLLLAMDQPFEVGQRVKIKGYEGFIREVGLRSTRISTLGGHEIIIPNEEAAKIEVENIGRRPYIRRDLNISITYDTPPEKIERATEILEEILALPRRTAQENAEDTPHPNEAINQPGLPPRVYFSDLNTDSLNLLVVYWFHPPDQWLYLEFAHYINMQIMERFNAEGIDFAFPSQTLYLAGDEKRPINLDRHAPHSRTNPVPVSGSGSVKKRRSKPTIPVLTLNDVTVEHDMVHGDEEAETGEPSDSSS